MGQQADAAMKAPQTHGAEVGNNEMSDRHLRAAGVKADFHVKMQLSLDLSRKNLLQGKSSQPQSWFKSGLSNGSGGNKRVAGRCRQLFFGKSAGWKAAGFFFNFFEGLES